ncbi:hypothetical protein K492DRAFT_9009 [Lichtheimia hyalospora FSU 10163]|nr:hypothetical protein K492DRAFT_9009 [Lichtheimia hyalospora FSU 10163]
MDYFRKTNYKYWRRNEAIKAYEEAYPEKTVRETIGLMHKDLRALMQDFRKPSMVAKAQNLLEDKNKARRTDITQSTPRNVVDFANANMTKSSNTFHLHGESNVSCSSHTPPQQQSVIIQDTLGKSNSDDNKDHDESNEDDSDNDDIISSRPTTTMTPNNFREKVFQLTVNALKNDGLMMQEAAELRSCVNGYHPQSPGAQLDLFAASLLGHNLNQVPIVSALKYVANGLGDKDRSC